MNMEEQRYKDALEKARVRYNEIKGTSSSEEKFLLDVFPDLAQSDDERIRKELIDAIQGLWDNDALPMPLSVRRKDEWLAWLIKQGETDKLIQELVKYKVKYTQEVLEKHINSMNNKDDERLRKTTIAFLKDFADKGYENAVECIDWLEKQGEDKSQSDSKKSSEQIKDFEGEFGCWNSAQDFRPKHLQRCLCYDKYMKGVYCYVYDDISKYWCTQTTEEHDNDGDNHICDYADYRVTVWMPLPDTPFYPSKSQLEKHSEQNHDDKVEPKFHKGDWITNGNSTLHITNMDYGFYQFEDSYDTISIIDEKYRLWSIQDAKDGDVLAFKNNLCGTIICKSPTDYDTKSYCRLVNDNFISKEESGWDSKLLVPATKEQRDLLFAKMKEECYTWDDEKKSVKEIEQNVDNIIDESYQQHADDLIDMVTETNWKPTKEQLDAFKHFVRSIGESGYASQYDNNTKQLYSLLNDLENLVKRR